MVAVALGVGPELGAAAPARASHERMLAGSVGLPWLVRLRWGAVGVHLVAVAIAELLLGLDLPLAWLLACIAFTATTNALLHTRSARLAGPRTVLAVLCTDVVVLTAMLVASGGPSNPLSVFFLAHVALAALLLEPLAMWSLVALTDAAYGSLFFLPVRAPTEHAHAHAHAWSMHLVGMWISYALSAVFVAYFVGRVSRALRERDLRLVQVSRIAAQNERLATLSSFSANAAHELGTPLATIGLAASELAVAVARGRPADELRTDAELICREIARCRSILRDIASRAGESVGEMPVATTPAGLVDALRAALSPRLAERCAFEPVAPDGADTPLRAPVRTTTQMLLNLLRNAVEAHEETGVEAPVIVRVTVGERLCFHVLDRGPGFPAEIHARLGEPFVTTKAALGGLGLGVYLARSYAERTGGWLRYAARPDGGTDAELCLPLDAVRSAHA